MDNVIVMRRLKDGRYSLVTTEALDLSEIYFDEEKPTKEESRYIINKYPKTIKKRIYSDKETYHQFRSDLSYSPFEEIEVFVIELGFDDNSGFTILRRTENFPIKGE